MRVARYYAPGDIRLDDDPSPVVGEGELLVRVRACSMCGTDVKISRSGHPNMTPPQVMGHEIAGEIHEVGAGVDGWTVGDRVQIIAAIPDGSCAECRRGHLAVCENQRSMGYQFPGGFAEHVIVPREVLAVDGVNRIPEALSYVEASVAEPLACVLNGQELARVGEGDTVVVIGSGPIGCLHVRLARARGAARVMLLDVNAERLARAAELVEPDDVVSPADDASAVQAVLDATGGRGADVVITAAASGPAQEAGLRMLARRGRLSLFGGLAKDAPMITVDANLVHYRELTLVGVNGSSPAHNREALELIASGRVPVADLVTHRLPLDRVLEAFDLVASGDAIKVTIEP
ncbi:zinc-dependent dehydrogenase [Homoserinibacter sp. YIM 151385]|uniref:zinc-dependent dehydrogenase n=1 Tax=Homoserinibacter sp. YIM 151385 TaxID=2985506 RepID=UPI0022EFDA49|nr:zinc-dependent dehydrogenase [Homoserinibacter sp. YIM 151385]WBU38621.1 zinc-dependent dehydrogenase [Homoserinibacter sp. YIM 151385]